MTDCPPTHNPKIGLNNPPAPPPPQALCCPETNGLLQDIADSVGQSQDACCPETNTLLTDIEGDTTAMQALLTQVNDNSVLQIGLLEVIRDWTTCVRAEYKTVPVCIGLCCTEAIIVPHTDGMF